MNKKLLTGMALSFVLLVVTLFGPYLAPYEKTQSVAAAEIEKDGETVVLHSPIPPSREHPFGTDFWGYDILSLMLHGIRYTVGAAVGIAGLRVFIGGLLGLIAGTRKKGPVSGGGKGFNAVPIFLLVYFMIFRISIESAVPKIELVLVQGLFIVLFGLPGIVSPVAAQTRRLMKEEFVEAVRTCGASRIRILLKHVAPHLREYFLVRFSNEMILVLTLLGQLAIFNIFFGGTHYTPQPPLFHSITQEIAGLVGESRNYITNSQWLLLFPLAGYLFILSAFSVLSRGLEAEFDRRRRRPWHV